MADPSPSRAPWRRDQLLVALALYCRLPFGRVHRRNPEIIEAAKAIGRSPSALAMKLANMASLDPDITDTGRTGLRASSANDRALWEEMHDDWERFADESQRALTEFGLSTNEDPAVPQPEQRLGEDRLVMGATRVGQSFFRSTVLSAYGGRCCVTGLSVPSLLIASHIVPWRCGDPRNRVNPSNGLLLCALHDRAFDAGLITVADDLTVLVSEAMLSVAVDDPFLASTLAACQGESIRIPDKFPPNGDFLAYHRERIFRG